MTDHGDQNDATTRRTFLEATAGAAMLGGVAGLVGAQQEGPQLIILGGRTPGWRGRAPASIEGDTNPPLPLVPGQDYEVLWINVDGEPHNFAVLDGEGNQLVSTDIISSQDATQRVTFTASEEMTEYYCEVHPTSMRGDVQLVEESQLEPVNETAINETEAGPPAAQNDTELVEGDVAQPIGLTNETFVETNQTQLQNFRQSRQDRFSQTGNGTLRGNLTYGTNETTNQTQQGQRGGPSPGDVRQAAEIPGFGVLTALGGLVGGAALLSKHSED